MSEDEGLGDSRAEDEGGAFENDEEMEEFMRQGGGVEYILKSDEEFGEDEDDAGKLEENKVEDEDRAEVVSPLAPQKSGVDTEKRVAHSKRREVVVEQEESLTKKGEERDAIGGGRPVKQQLLHPHLPAYGLQSSHLPNHTVNPGVGQTQEVDQRVEAGTGINNTRGTRFDIHTTMLYMNTNASPHRRPESASIDDTGDQGYSKQLKSWKAALPTRTFQVREMFLHKVGKSPHWPVQVSSVDGDEISVEYYGSGETGTISKAGRSSLLPFTEEMIRQLKLDESVTLRKALKAARDSL